MNQGVGCGRVTVDGLLKRRHDGLEDLELQRRVKVLIQRGVIVGLEFLQQRLLQGWVLAAEGENREDILLGGASVAALLATLVQCLIELFAWRVVFAECVLAVPTGDSPPQFGDLGIGIFPCCGQCIDISHGDSIGCLFAAASCLVALSFRHVRSVAGWRKMAW